MVTRAQTAVTIGHTACCSGHKEFLFLAPADTRVGEMGLKSLLLNFPVPLLQLLLATETQSTTIVTELLCILIGHRDTIIL